MAGERNRIDIRSLAQANAARRKENRARQAAAKKGPDPSAQRYLDQYKSVMALVGRLSLSLMAIIAFWMAIEINHEHRAQVVRSQNELAQGELARRDLYFNSIRDNISGDQKDKFAKQIQAQEKQNDDLRKDVKDLRKENVAFSILGTTILSPAGYGPLIWLAAVLVVAITLRAKRKAALEALAGYLNRIPPDSDYALAAGDGSMWLAPLPDAVYPVGSRSDEEAVIIRNEDVEISGVEAAVVDWEGNGSVAVC